MGLDLTDLGAGAGSPVLEAFWPSEVRGFDVIPHGTTFLPFEVVERFIAPVRRTLPVRRRSEPAHGICRHERALRSVALIQPSMGDAPLIAR